MKVKHILDTLMNVYIIYECYVLQGYTYLLKSVREKVLEGRSGNYCPKFMNGIILKVMSGSCSPWELRYFPRTCCSKWQALKDMFYEIHVSFDGQDTNI